MIGCAAGLALLAIAPAELATAAVAFRHALDDSPLDLAPLPGEAITDAVRSFYDTGQDPYVGDAAAIADGQKLYKKHCSACHLPDATGRIGPSLVDDVHINERAGTDVGMFEVIHSGSAGAMRPFSQRGVTQDQILRIIAFIHSLRP
jgi:cytochrome c-L